MKKFLFCSFIIFSIVFSLFFLPVHSANEISVYLNEEKLVFDVPPVNIDGRILVPFRGILEALGAEVTYTEGDGKYLPERIAMGKTYGKMLTIPIGENFVIINSCSVELDVPAQIINGRTLVPVRVVSECMGAHVEWDNSTQSVIITASPEIQRYWNDSCSYYGDVTLTDDSYIANGYGTIYDDEDGTVRCQGYFENDLIIEGVFYYSDSSSYTGQFSDTEFANKHGKGRILFDNYSMLEGFWNNDVSEGDFHFYDYKTNTHIYGTYVNGKLDGEITVYNPDDGTTETVSYKNGEIVSTQAPNAPSYPSNHNSSAPSRFTTAKYPLYLYSNDGKTFLGKLVSDKYDNDSFSNSYGAYGSKYSHTSIFNEYGNYGSKYSSESAFNKYASRPPIIVDSNGQFISYLTANEYNIEGITYLELMSILRDRYQ